MKIYYALFSAALISCSISSADARVSASIGRMLQDAGAGAAPDAAAPDMNVDPNAAVPTDVNTDPNAQPADDPNAEPAADPNAEPAADPNAEPAADPNAEPAADPNAEPAADPNASDAPTADVNATTTAATVTTSPFATSTGATSTMAVATEPSMEPAPTDMNMTEPGMDGPPPPGFNMTDDFVTDDNQFSTTGSTTVPDLAGDNEKDPLASASSANSLTMFVGTVAGVVVASAAFMMV
jgi:hypothetical protein